MFQIDVIKIRNLGYGVNARTLWKNLESGHKFADWIKIRLHDAKAQAGVDYQSFSEISEKPRGGRPNKEYIVSLRIAKKIAMLEATDKGDKVRDYFIECEEKLYSKQVEKSLPKNYIEALEALLKSEKEKALLEHKNSVIEHSGNTYTASDIAKDFGISATKLNKILSEHKIQFKRGRRWYPYAGYESWYSIKETIRSKGKRSSVTTRFTLKGKLGVQSLLFQGGYLEDTL